MRADLPARGRHAPVVVWIAAALASAFAAGFVVTAGQTVAALVAHKGGLAHPDRLALRGAVDVTVLLAVGAVWCVVGAVRILRGRGVMLVTVPLALVVLIGIPGEIGDAVGHDGTGRDLLIGVAIIAAATATVGLLYSRPARAWRRRPQPDAAVAADGGVAGQERSTSQPGSRSRQS